jgi:hypothetical protein
MFDLILLLLETHHGSLVVVDGGRINHLGLVQRCEQLLFHSVILVDLYGAHGGVQLGLAPIR